MTVAAADAAGPTASIVTYKDSDCLGEGAPAGTFILAWICEEEMDIGDDSIEGCKGAVTSKLNLTHVADIEQSDP